ncbi:autophagy protein Apg5-domain-containing protein [Neurospora hispaniola]|uniref:Autophagy protein 5 n=1 Tax=Neurospora hispaniola TaxID=588809 RepID=A0AAJ0IEM7_9PEZI|nr:autophagy protein Apg5-domain-containing protein [Neurospora hispaniola]
MASPNPYSYSPQLPQREESPYQEDQYQSSPSFRSTPFRSSRGTGAGAGIGLGLSSGFISSLRGGAGGPAEPRSGDGSHDDLPQRSSSSSTVIPSLPPKPKPTSIPETLWSLQIPLHITHQSHPKTPYICSVPRFSYLALLLPRLTAYYGTPCSSFHHEEVHLRNFAVGLLVDLYQPSELPWRLTVADGMEWDICDTFMNSAKEADFIRNGNAKRIMGLSKEHTTALWNAVQDNDYQAFTKVNTHLLNAPIALKNVPIRIYIPSSPPPPSPDQQQPQRPGGSSSSGSYRVMQTLVPPRGSNNRTPQTLGQALKSLLPALFPSSRDPVLANVILHGAPVPFSAPLEELMRDAAYPDGWLCLIVVLL